jgi:hypothetical protein
MIPQFCSFKAITKPLILLTEVNSQSDLHIKRWDDVKTYRILSNLDVDKCCFPYDCFHCMFCCKVYCDTVIIKKH